MTFVRHNRSNAQRGFTLIEVILALGLMIWMLAGVYSFYFTTMRVKETTREVVRDASLTYGLLSQISNELRQTVDIIPGDGKGFQGTENRITFVSTRIPEREAFNSYESMMDDPPRGQMDVYRISYALSYDEENEDEEGNPICLGLWRSVEKTLDPNPSFSVDEESMDAVLEATYDEDRDERPMMEGELLTPEIKFLEFEYFDGMEWHDRWHVPEKSEEGDEADNSGIPGAPDGGDELGGLDGMDGLLGGSGGDGASDGGYALPQMIRVTIGFIPEPRDEDGLSSVVSDEFAEEMEGEEYHEDRFTVQVFLPVSDPTLLSSRKYGVEKSGGDGEYEVGGE